MDLVRVLHVVAVMDRGGIETLIMNLYRNMDRSRVQFDFLTHKSGKAAYDDEIEAMGGRIYHIPYVSKVGHFAYVKAINGFFKEHREYKIIHSHMNTISGLILRSAGKYGIPVRISHSHTSNPNYKFFERMYKSWVKRLIKKNATDYFACSESAGKWLFGKDVSKERMKIVKNGVDLASFKGSPGKPSRLMDELGLEEDIYIVGHVGRFDEYKNQTFLVDVFKEVHKKMEKSVLLLVGTGEMKSAVEEKVKRLGLQDCIKFLGVRCDVPELLRMFDVLLFPSVFEGVPVVLIEAQAAGVGCVLSDSISGEADTGAALLKYISLNQPAAEWAREVLSTPKRHRDTHKLLKEKGFDIVQTAKGLEEFYLKALG